jgi:hypothetical protein
MHLLDQNGEELTAADIDAWYESLTDQDVFNILESIDPTEIVQELFATEEMLAVIDGIPLEWREEIIRAYTVFGVDEFAFFGKSGAALKDWLSEKAQKQVRDPKGMFRDVRASIAKAALKKVDPNAPILSRPAPRRGKAIQDKAGNIVGIEKLPEKNIPEIDYQTKPDIVPSAPDIHKGRKEGTGELNDPIDISQHLTADGKIDYEKAVSDIADGKHVRINDGDQLRTVVSTLGKMYKDAKAKGHEKVYNLCQATLPNSSLFCAETIGKPRVVMPQTEGATFANTIARLFHAKKPGDEKSDITGVFEDLISDVGYTPQIRKGKASHFTASQNELDGTDLANNVDIWNDRMKLTLDRVDEKITGTEEGSAEREKLTALRKQLTEDKTLMLKFADFANWERGDQREENAAKKRAKAAEKGETLNEWGKDNGLADDQTDLLDSALEEAVSENKDMASIISETHAATKSRQTLVDQNGYIVDGHHRWATDVIMNGDGEMMVKMIPMDIGEVLDLSTALTTMYGIKPAGASDAERAKIDATPEAEVKERVAKAERNLRIMISSITDWSGNQVDEYMEYLKSNPKTRKTPAWLGKIREDNKAKVDDISTQLDSTKRNAMMSRAEAAKRRAARQSKQRELVPA